MSPPGLPTILNPERNPDPEGTCGKGARAQSAGQRSRPGSPRSLPSLTGAGPSRLRHWWARLAWALHWGAEACACVKKGLLDLPCGVQSTPGPCLAKTIGSINAVLRGGSRAEGSCRWGLDIPVTGRDWDALQRGPSPAWPWMDWDSGAAERRAWWPKASVEEELQQHTSALWGPNPGLCP